MSANATVGIEIGLPGDDWYASLYARQVGPDLTEAMLVCVLQEIGAAEFHVFDYRIPNKHDEIDRSISIATKADMRFQISDAMSAIYGPFVPGTGRPEWPATDLDRLARSGVCSACVWHEFDARINAYHHWPRPWLTEPTRPYYPLEPGLDLGASQQALSDQIAADVRPFAQRDLTVAVKHQDNTLVHLTARAGAVPNPMILKQAYNAVSFAIALGAAKQYGRPLWATLDMCGPDIMWSFNFPRHPGHSPIEFYNTLVLAYWMGAEKIMAEALDRLMVVEPRWTKSQKKLVAEHPIVHNNPTWRQERGYVLTAYGQYLMQFSRQYIAANPRPYSHDQVRPKVAIVHFDDGMPSLLSEAAGPDSPWARDRMRPYGMDHLAPYAHESDNYIKVWHVLTHGHASGQALHASYDTAEDAQWAALREKARHMHTLTPHPTYHSGFQPIDGVVVFDDEVTEELLRHAELIILCGHAISHQSRQAVQRCVARGADCLAEPHLVANGMKATSDKVPDGKGFWQISTDFTSPDTRAFIEPHLGPPDVIRYRFGEHVVTIRQVLPGSDVLECTVKHDEGNEQRTTTI